MSTQMTLGTGLKKYGKTTRRETFLTEMDRIVPWGELCALIASVYPKAGDSRPPKDLKMMLRIYFVQQWFNLSDPGVEEALYDSLSMRRFAGIDLGEMPVPDESTVCRFRHLLDAHALGKKSFEQVHAYLERRGIKIGAGTIVDATPRLVRPGTAPIARAAIRPIPNGLLDPRPRPTRFDSPSRQPPLACTRPRRQNAPKHGGR